jgi:hypothetical protein
MTPERRYEVAELAVTGLQLLILAVFIYMKGFDDGRG